MTTLPGAVRAHSHFLRVNGLVLHARVYRGALPGAPPLVVVPGLGCASWMYHRLARELASEREVWVYDHPGMGLSEASWADPVKIEQLTEHLVAWIRARGFGPLPILGHSLGGEVAIDLAARHPELPSSLIMCAPTGIPENPSVSAQVVRFLLNLPRERPGLYPLAAAAYLRIGVRRMYILARDQDLHQSGPLISQVRCPVLVMDGTADPVIRSWTLSVMCEQLARSSACTIEGGTHALMDSRPEQVAREALKFLRSVEHGDAPEHC